VLPRWSVLLLATASCGSSELPGTPDAGSTLINAADVPIDGLSRDDIARFDDGDALFGLPFRPADGLGPLYIRTSCAACHREGARGPGLVQKLAVVEADGVTPAADPALPWGHTVRAGLAAGATTPITAPVLPGLKVTIRIGPPVFGRGYLEAVDDAELARLEAEQAARGDAIQGRRNRTAFASLPNPDPTFGRLATGQPVIGRFGLKARIATLDDFTADAFQGDMGLTTPMRPAELANPDGRTDDLRPGVDLAQDHIDRIAFYLRRIAIPRRVGLSERGAAVFAEVQCAACHVPALRTRADYPIRALAGIAAPVYTDLLLHDMGPALADGQTDGSASSPAWRTAPLIGLRFSASYLHDGRAATPTDAVLAHDGEAAASRTAFQALSPDDQRFLIDFISAL
jgi:CxxC motif-containing protein (DUF1111 family)